jgi:hypothetical protein
MLSTPPLWPGTCVIANRLANLKKMMIHMHW